MPNPPTKVAISYNWTTEEHGDANSKTSVAKGQVEEFCQHLQALGVPVIRDTGGLKLGDDLLEFMRRIGTADHVCVFLSEHYLKSANCMNELVIAWENLQHQPQAFEQRVHVWVMPSANDLFAHNDTFTRQWADYWIKERDRQKAVLDEQDAKGLGSGGRPEYERIRRYPEAIDKIFPKLKGTICARSIAELKEWASKTFPPPTPEEEAAQLAEVYAGTVAEMNVILSDHPKVADFISQHCPGVVVKKGNVPQLSDAVRQQQFCEMKHFETLEKKLHSFSGLNLDLERLARFIGGMAVLTVNREWVLNQRRAWLAGCALFPGRDSKYGMDDMNPHFLPLLTNALAEGCLDIDRPFATDDERVLNDRPTRSKGIGPDAMRESKLYFIDKIVRPDEKNLIFNRDSDDEVNAVFKRIPKLLKYARWTQHDPYYTTDPKLEPFRKLIRNDMNLEDLLLIFPEGKGSDLEDVVDAVPLFKSLHNINKSIQQRRTTV